MGNKGLGKLTIVDAICWSSDPVFYELGRRLGIDDLGSYALTFGLGQATRIKLGGEEQGTVPTQGWKRSYLWGGVVPRGNYYCCDWTRVLFSYPIATSHATAGSSQLKAYYIAQ